jgi:hypothetical protein
MSLVHGDRVVLSSMVPADAIGTVERAGSAGAVVKFDDGQTFAVTNAEILKVVAA